MKITHLKKSSAILYFITLSAVSFGLFYSYNHFSTWSGSNVYQSPSRSEGDTIQSRKTDPTDSVFRATLVAADKFLNDKAYEKCLSELRKAQLIKPNDASLKDRMTKLNGLIATQKQQIETSQKSIASGDAYFKNKDYLNAKSAYQLAVSQNSDDTIAQQKLRKTMDLLRSQKAQNILFDVAVAGADKLYQAGDLVKAQQEYENASKLLPGDPYPKSKINEIIKIQVDRQVKDEEYAQAIVSADKFYFSKSYQNALLDYKKAANIKPDEKYPKEKINELSKVLADLKAKEDAYNKAIASGDQAFKATQYPESLKSFQAALVIKPGELYPSNKIKEIEGILAKIAKAQADYDQYIVLADSFYIGKQYLKARDNYQMAISAKPSESYPKQMMTKAEMMMTGQEAAMSRLAEEQYAKAISAGDKLLLDKAYAQAKLQYQEALKIKAAEQYPKDKLTEIDKVMTELGLLKDRDAKYAAAITNGDKLFLQKSYGPARAEYANASSIKLDENYPKEKMAAIDKILADLAEAKELEDKYTGIIAAADKLFVAKSYDQARVEYQKAGEVKPETSYPKEKMAAIDKILSDLAALKSLDENYKAGIAKADQYLLEKSYDLARAEYVKASGLKPAEQYPKTKITEIDGILTAIAKQKALDDEYAADISNGDKLLADKSYAPARLQYQAALKIKAAEQYPKDKLTEIDKALAELALMKDRDSKYAAAIANGDKLLAQKSYAPARIEFTNASAIMPQESDPKDKIAEIDATLASIAKQKELDDRYAGTLASANKLFAAKTYDQARVEFQNAGTLKPDESYPKERIAAIDKILADIAATQSLEENYKALISKADQYLAEKSYDLAKGEYTKAIGLKPAEQYPKTKVAEIDGILAAIARQKALDDEFAAAIAGGDKLLADKAYDQARLQYQAALKLKAAEQYPKDKITEIDKVLAELALMKDRDSKYAAAIANGDKLLAQKSYAPARIEFTNASAIKPQESYPKDKIAEIDATLAAIAKQKELDDRYAGTLASANKLFAAKTYDQARVEFQNAGTLKPEESYPKERIAAIDKILADIAAAQSLEENYKALISKADQYLTEKSYDLAKGEYTKAIGLKPAEQYPKTKVAEIDGILAAIARQKALDDEFAAAIAGGDKLLADKAYDQARLQYQAALKLKAAEQYPKDKITEIDKALAELALMKDRDSKYAAAIANGDKLLAQKSYAPARAEYANASSIKLDENYPKEKMAAIDKILADLAEAKALEDKYTGIIAAADKLFVAKSYDQARVEYQKAGEVKPEASYPKEKMAAIDKILSDLAALKSLDENYKAGIAKADQNLLEKSYDLARAEYVKASGLKPAEQYPKTKITEIDGILTAIAKQKALDDEYAANISSGDKLLADKSYEQAMVEFKKAAALKTSEQYPRIKLAEIEKVLTDIARLKAIEDQYTAAVTAADKLFQDKAFDQAKTAYLEAGKIKAAEQYPRDKVIEINGILATLARQKSIDDQYKASVSKADQFLAAKTYDQARLEYLNAGKLKADEQYPTNKIAEIDAVLAEMKAKEEAYKASVAAADQLLLQKKYNEARIEYQAALEIKAQAIYPKEKITEIEKALEELLGKQKYYENLLLSADNLLKEKEYAKALESYQLALKLFPAQIYPKDQIGLISARVDSLYRANKSFYDKAVADGDRFYNSYEFDKAVDAFTDAANFLPMEKYPREMIVKIRRTIAENAIADVMKTTVVIPSNTEKQFPFSPVNIASRKNNFVYIKIKNLSGKPFNILMRYGKDKQANGGVVMRNLSMDGKVNERLVSVKDQDLWSREDNNWISLYPQGGDVEVSFIQVSRAK